MGNGTCDFMDLSDTSQNEISLTNSRRACAADSISVHAPSDIRSRASLSVHIHVCVSSSRAAVRSSDSDARHSIGVARQGGLNSATRRLPVTIGRVCRFALMITTSHHRAGQSQTSPMHQSPGIRYRPAKSSMSTKRVALNLLAEMVGSARESLTGDSARYESDHAPSLVNTRTLFR